MDVVVVTFDSTEDARAYVQRNELKWPLLIDSDRSSYMQFGMGRVGWWKLINPSSMWKYVLLLCKGAKPQKTGSDVHQLGGNVLIDPEGVLRLNYVSKEPHDRPEVEDLLAVVRSS